MERLESDKKLKLKRLYEINMSILKEMSKKREKNNNKKYDM